MYTFYYPEKCVVFLSWQNIHHFSKVVVSSKCGLQPFQIIWRSQEYNKTRKFLQQLLKFLLAKFYLRKRRESKPGFLQHPPLLSLLQMCHLTNYKEHSSLQAYQSRKMLLMYTWNQSSLGQTSSLNSWTCIKWSPLLSHGGHPCKGDHHGHHESQ